MLSKKLPLKKTGFLFLAIIIAGLFLTNINSTEAVAWETITDLPGLPAGSEVSLSDFIIVLYDFLLSAVGIAAMFMIVVGGFRYLTAAGNAASMAEAKDIIYSALYGLILALSTWIIVSTINPDLLYLKKPGTTVSHADYSCMSSGMACVVGDNCCYGVCGGGVCPKKPISCKDPTSSERVNDGDNCKCIDKSEILMVPGQDCSDTCRPNNCLVADIKIGISSISSSGGTNEIVVQKIKDSTSLGDYPNCTKPLYVSEGSAFSLLIESSSGSSSSYALTKYNWDIFPPYDGNTDFTGTGPLFSYWVTSGDLDFTPPVPPSSIPIKPDGMIGYWDYIENTNKGKCQKRFIPFTAHYEAWVCPISLTIIDGAGVGSDSNIDVAYIGFEKPNP